MTPVEFDAAVAVTGADPESRTTAAARLVLVDGMSGYAAAKLVGVRQSAVSRAVRKLRITDCPACGRALTEDCG